MRRLQRGEGALLFELLDTRLLSVGTRRRFVHGGQPLFAHGIGAVNLPRTLLLSGADSVLQPFLEVQQLAQASVVCGNRRVHSVLLHSDVLCYEWLTSTDGATARCCCSQPIQ